MLSRMRQFIFIVVANATAKWRAALGASCLSGLLGSDWLRYFYASSSSDTPQNGQYPTCTLDENENIAGTTVMPRLPRHFGQRIVKLITTIAERNVNIPASTKGTGGSALLLTTTASKKTKADTPITAAHARRRLIDFRIVILTPNLFYTCWIKPDC